MTIEQLELFESALVDSLNAIKALKNKPEMTERQLNGATEDIAALLGLTLKEVGASFMTRIMIDRLEINLGCDAKSVITIGDRRDIVVENAYKDGRINGVVICAALKIEDVQQMIDSRKGESRRAEN